jgi:histidinol-phosphate aminotransferase
MYSSRLKRLSPYVPGEQPRDRRYMKLNTNENPYPPSPRVAELLSSYSPEDLRRYPDPGSLSLREAIAKREGVRSEQVFVGNGSDEILSFCFYAFFDPERGPVLFPRHTYSFYPVYCNFYGNEFRHIRMAEDFSIPAGTVIEALNGSAGYIFPNPNAPTGMETDRADIERIAERAKELNLAVIVDEAYIEFGGASAVPLLDRFDNLLVVRTFSKSHCLAGVRLGYAVGNTGMIESLTMVKDSFNSYPVDRLSEEIGIAAIEDEDYYRDINRRVIASRDRLSDAMRNEGWTVLPSKANFVFMMKEGLSGKAIYERLKEGGILVRYFEHPGIEEYVRVTVGTEDETAAFIDALRRLA